MTATTVDTGAPPRQGGAQPYRRGYSAPADARAFLKERHTTHLGLTVLAALFDHACIAAMAAIGLVAFRVSPWLALVLYPLLTLGAARGQRGLENLVHEASHYNWTRSRRRLNDLLADLMAASPVFSLVDHYRTNHKLHHHQFGTDQDSCLARYEQLDIESLDRGSIVGLLGGLGRRMAGYVVGWWWAIRTSPTVLGLGLLWHVAVLLLPLSLVLGPAAAVSLWAAFWIAPFFFVLPWMRFLAEAAKHEYHGHDNLVDSTVSNIGTMHSWLLHPHDDGYHLMHHLHPGIPHHQLKAAHEGLKRLDPAYARISRERQHVLEEPELQSLAERA